MSRRTVLVVDDHPLYREGLVTALSMLDGVDVVAEAGDGCRPWSSRWTWRPTSW